MRKGTRVLAQRAMQKHCSFGKLRTSGDTFKSKCDFLKKSSTQPYKESDVLRTHGDSYGKMHSHMSLSVLLGTTEYSDFYRRNLVVAI